MPRALKLLRNYGLLLAAVAGLSWFPLTGFFLMLFTLGLLPALIVNVMLIHLAVAATDGRIERGWLAAPVICYGVWAVWCGWLNIQAYRDKYKLEAENRVVGDVQSDVALVFPDNDTLAIRAKRHLAAPLRVFMGSAELGPIGPYQMICNLWTKVERARCPTEAPSTPPIGSLVFRQIEEPARGSNSLAYRYEIMRTIASGDAQPVGRFNFGLMRAPVPFPLLHAGCVLIDNPPAWSCGVFPMTRDITIGETGSAEQYDSFHQRSDPVIATLATMLGARYVGDVEKP